MIQPRLMQIYVLVGQGEKCGHFRVTLECHWEDKHKSHHEVEKCFDCHDSALSEGTKVATYVANKYLEAVGLSARIDVDENVTIH